MKLTFALLAPALLAATSTLAPSGGVAGGPEVGKPAPLARLNDHTGTVQTIGGEREKWTVLAFFPKAMTPG